MLESRECYGCGETGHIRKIVQNRVIDLQMLEEEVVMEEAVILEDAVVEVMVVTKTVGVTDKWELLQRIPVEATGRQVIGPIVTLSLDG